MWRSVPGGHLEGEWTLILNPHLCFRASVQNIINTE